MASRAGAGAPAKRKYNAAVMAKRRWRRASWLAIALTFIGIVVSVRLGVWQLDRAGQAQALLDAFAGAATATPEDFSTVNTNPPADRFPKVRVRGHFLADRGWWRDEQLNGGESQRLGGRNPGSDGNSQRS